MYEISPPSNDKKSSHSDPQMLDLFCFYAEVILATGLVRVLWITHPPSLAP